MAKPGEIYAVYIWGGTDATLKLPEGTYSTDWYSPRKGGDLIPGGTLRGPGKVALGKPTAEPEKDWVLLVRKKK